MKQRLQKILSDRSVASRRKAEEMIRSGVVSVNGQTAALGDSADGGLHISDAEQAQGLCDHPFR